MGYLESWGIKAVAFDIDGTLYKKSQTHKYLILSGLVHPILSLKYNSMRQNMRKADGYDVKPVLTRSEFRAKEALCLKIEDNYEELYERVFFIPWEKRSQNLKPFEGVKDALALLKEKGYVLAALSDFPLGHKLEYLGLSAFFDYKASSEDSGYLKPNGTSFKVMLDELSLPPGEVLYVGDSYSKDIIGAKKMNMRAVLINKHAGARGYPEADLVLTGWDKFIKIMLEGEFEE